MAPTNLSDYKDLYMQTAKEYVSSLSENTSLLAQNPQDLDATKAIHMGSHSLKSQSQVMGYNDIASICLNIEKTSDAVLKGNSTFNDRAVSNIKKSVEELDEILKSIRQGQDDTGK